MEVGEFFYRKGPLFECFCGRVEPAFSVDFGRQGAGLEVAAVQLPEGLFHGDIAGLEGFAVVGEGGVVALEFDQADAGAADPTGLGDQDVGAHADGDLPGAVLVADDHPDPLAALGTGELQASGLSGTLG